MTSGSRRLRFFAGPTSSSCLMRGREDSEEVSSGPVSRFSLAAVYLRGQVMFWHCRKD